MKARRGLEKFSGGGWGVGGPQSDYSVCPRPLRRVFDFSGFWFSGVQVFGFSGFQVFRTGRDARFFGQDGTRSSTIVLPKIGLRISEHFFEWMNQREQQKVK